MFSPVFPKEIGGTLARAGIRRWRVPVVREEPAGPGTQQIGMVFPQRMVMDGAPVM